MAQLTADRKSERKQGSLFALPTAAAAHLYAGALVTADSAGYLQPASDATGQIFVGVSKKEADNTSGANGDVTCEGYLKGVFQMNASGITQADLVKEAFVVDDNTIGLGIVAQPTNVTGVTVHRTANSEGGTKSLSYTNSGTTLAWGGGTAVTVSASGDYILTATDGSRIMVTVTAASLPGTDQSDNVQLRYIKVGRIIEVLSSTSVFIDISKAARS